MKRGKRPRTAPSLVGRRCQKRGGGPFTVPQDKVYKTTKGGASDLEGRINNVAHKSVLSACYLVYVGGAYGRRVATSTCGLRFMGEYWEHSLGSVVSYGAGRTGWGLLGFLGVGLVGGLFGVGGWAPVPAFNPVMGLPLVAVAAYVKATVALGDATAGSASRRAGLLRVCAGESCATRVCGGTCGITVRAQ
jgi:uncharacterized membrane protein YuzA (DUF378 family)